MSLACGMECVMMIACSRWIWKRCTYIGSYDSKSWPYATPDEFSPIPRMSRLILAVYEDDLNNPHYLPPHHSINPDWLIKRVTYSQTLGHAPPYIIYLDHHHKELVVAIRGLNLVKESDYKLLLDNKLGMQMFDGGYVHHGLLRSAIWLLNEEGDLLRKLWLETGKEYDLVFAGHSLGSGVAALATVVVANHRDELGGIPRSKIKCYALAPARSMSLNLAVKYADIIHSIVLQDDFLPRTSTPLEYIFESIFCLPCLLFWVCVRDTFIPEGRKLRDPRRLYAPGRMYHIVERKFCRCGRFPPEVRTAIPVEGRFEHIVLSCNATSDHGIIWIEREAEKALKITTQLNYQRTSPTVTTLPEEVAAKLGLIAVSGQMLGELMTESSNETATTPPQTQKFKRSETFEDEHIDALRKAVSMNIPHAVSSTEDELRQDKDTSEKVAAHSQEAGSSHDEEKGTSEPKSKHSGKTNWDEVVQKLFRKSESGEVVLKKDIEAPAPQ